MKRYIICVAIGIAMFGCNSDRKDDASSESSVLIESKDSIGTSDAATPKIIKTAEIRFRVKDVQTTKEQLSAAIKAQGGSVAEFSINSAIQQSDKVKYTTDSLKEIISYRKEGLLIAKIPYDKLDDFTNKVAKMAVFVDQQSMKMDDQSLNYLINKLKLQNGTDAVNTINQTAKRKGNNVATSLYIKDDNVDRKIDNMNIDNRVKFSTITLNFYQDNTVKTIVVANDRLYDYRPSFFQRLGLNMLDGWKYFKELILALSHLWMFFIVGFVVFFGLRYYLRRKKV